MITLDFQEGHIKIIGDAVPIAPLPVISQLNFWGFKVLQGESFLSLASSKPAPT